MKKLLKISPSQLEQYRTVRLGMYNKTDADLIDYFMGDFQPNIHTSRGNAYGELLEHGPMKYARIDGVPFENTRFKDQAASNWPYEKMTFWVDEPEFGKTWEFHHDDVAPVFEIRSNYPTMTYETWNTIYWDLPEATIRMNMRYDGLTGFRAHEFKTTGRKKKYSDYRDTMQTKAYLCGFKGLQELKYHVFTFYKRKPLEYDQFVYKADPGIEDQVKSELRGLVNWIFTKPEILQKITIDE